MFTCRLLLATLNQEQAISTTATNNQHRVIAMYGYKPGLILQ